MPRLHTSIDQTLFNYDGEIAQKKRQAISELINVCPANKCRECPFKTISPCPANLLPLFDKWQDKLEDFKNYGIGVV